MALVIALVLFILYVSNVVWGALTASPVLNDVSEMLVLFAASVAFVVAILRIEKQSNESDAR